MSEQYLYRGHTTSCVVIESRAAQEVDETIIKMLRLASNVRVLGQYLIGQDIMHYDPVSQKHIPWPEPRQYMLRDMSPTVERFATSLRWREGHQGYPTELQAGFAALTLYEQAYDRYIDVPVVPELGFYITEI